MDSEKRVPFAEGNAVESGAASILRIPGPRIYWCRRMELPVGFEAVALYSWSICRITSTQRRGFVREEWSPQGSSRKTA